MTETSDKDWMKDLFAEIVANSAKLRNSNTTNEPFILDADIPFKQSNKISREIEYKGDYLDGEALDVAITFGDRNQYIIKSGTGAGLTTAMLNKVKKSLIISTPNKSQVKNKKAKEHTYNKDITRFYIWGVGKEKKNAKFKPDTWKQVYEALLAGKLVVVMTVVDSFVHLKTNEPEIYEYLKDIHLLSDECHTIIKDSFRKIMKPYYEALQTWRVSVKLSTATPQPQFIDIPIGMNFEIIKVSSVAKLNQRVMFSTNKDDAYDFIQSKMIYEQNVVLFTNEPKGFNKCLATYSGNGGDSITNRVHCATGKSLRNSINRFETESDIVKSTDIISNAFETDDVDYKSLEHALTLPHKDLFICSSAYFAGWDFTKRTNIVIMADQATLNFSFDWLDMVQSMGRGREGFFDILIIIAPPALGKDGVIKQRTGVDWLPYNPTVTQEQLSNRIAEIGINDTYEKMVKLGTAHNQFLTLNEQARLEHFASYGYHLEPYTNSGSIADWHTYKFTDYMNHLLTYDLHTIDSVIRNEGTYEMRNFIYEDAIKETIGTISAELVLQYYIAKILMVYQPQSLLQQLADDFDRQLKFKDFAFDMMQFMLQFLDSEYHNLPFDYDAYTGDTIEDGEPKPTEDMVYEYILLYGGCEFSKEIYSHEVERQLRISVVMGDRVGLNRFVDRDKKTRIDESLRYMKSRLKRPLQFESDELGDIELSSDEVLYARINIRRNFEYLDNLRYENKLIEEKAKKGNKLFEPKLPYNINTKSSLLTKIKRASLFFFTRGKGTFAEKVKENRTYSPLSSLPKNLRVALFIRFKCFDIKSANPSIICLILGIKNDIPFYKNIETRCSKGEGEGKVEFNSILNKHFLGKNEAIRFYTFAGFTNDDAIKLANMTAGVLKGSMFNTMTYWEALLIAQFINAACKKYPNNLTTDMFYRLHDAVVIPAYHLADYELETTFKNGNVRFELTHFNGTGRGEF